MSPHRTFTRIPLQVGSELRIRNDGEISVSNPTIEAAPALNAADPVVAKTLSLVERGLQQVRHTVSALLVETRVENRALTPEDVDDVRTLLEPEAQARQQRPLSRPHIFLP